MIQAYPTKNGTGIAIFGDYGDLYALYQSVHEVANSLDENNIQLSGQHKLLMNFQQFRKKFIVSVSPFYWDIQSIAKNNLLTFS